MMKSRINATAMLVGLCLALPCRAEVRTTAITLEDDSSHSFEYVIGGPTVRADFDTSIAYHSEFWEDMSIQLKFVANAAIADPTGAADSGAVTFVLQMSNDAKYWTPIDSILAPDSLAAFKVFTLKPYRWARFIVHHAVKTDSAGVNGTAILNARGRQ